MTRRAATLRIRTEQPQDVATIRAVLLAAFPTPAEADLVEALRDGGSWLPQFSLVALGEGPDGGERVIGHVLLSRMRVGGGAALALAPLAVAPEEQHHRVGSGLVEAALAAADVAGEELVIVLGDPGFYTRFGFRPAVEIAITGPYGSGPEFQAMPLPPGRRGRDILTLPAGEAHYPAPFDRV